MPDRFPPPSAYDLDTEPPPPCVVEVTSPKSHFTHLERHPEPVEGDKVPFYLGLGIATYLVIDAITPGGELRQQIELHLWRLVEDQAREMQPETQEWLALPEMGVKVLAQGQRLIFADAVTGETLLDTEQLTVALGAETRAEARRAAEAEIARLQALLAN